MTTAFTSSGALSLARPLPAYIEPKESMRVFSNGVYAGFVSTG